MTYRRRYLVQQLVRRTLIWTIPITCITALIFANAATTVTGPSQQASTQPAFTDLSGSATCAQLPALTGDTTTSSGSCATTTGKVNGVTYGASPSTNTVPVVTSSNTITYEGVPNAALVNASTTVNGQTCSLGSSCTVGAAPTQTTKTSNYTIVSGDNGTWFNNTGASAAVTFTLPATPATSQFNCFLTTAAHTLEILAPASTTINVGPTASAAAGNMQQGALYNTVCLVSISSTVWAATAMTGTWTVN